MAEAEKKQAPEADKKAKPVMNRNVKHDGVEYPKGSECPDKHAEFFKKQGFVS